MGQKISTCGKKKLSFFATCAKNEILKIRSAAYSSYKFTNGLSIFWCSRIRIRIQYINWLRNNDGNQKKRQTQ